jgi:peptide/nickel transport system permease protein
VSTQLASELVRALASLSLLVFATFWLVRLTGNPLEISMGDRLTEAELARRISNAGLDKPFFEQLGEYAVSMSRGDFGSSVFSERSVGSMLLSSMGTSLELAVPTMLIAISLAYLLATVAIRRFSSWGKTTYGLLSISIFALPAFLIAVPLKALFSGGAAALPASGRMSLLGQIQYQSLETKSGFVVTDAILQGRFDIALDAITHLILPVMALSLIMAAVLTRIYYLQIQASLEQPYVTGARAKGLKEFRLLHTHGTRPVLSRMVAISGIEIAALFTGVIYIENAFELRGLGFLLVESVLQRDYPVVQGVTVFIGTVVIIFNLFATGIAALLEPRNRQ